MIEHLIPEWRKKHTISAWAAVGSRVTCDPAPTDTDADFLILLSPVSVPGAQITPSIPGPAQQIPGSALNHFRVELDQFGWEIGGSLPLDPECGGYAPQDRFNSFTRGEINLIVTESPEFFSKFIAATTLAKKYNLLEKSERIDLFQTVLYGSPKQPIEVRYPAMDDHRARMEKQELAPMDWDDLLDELL